MKYIYVAGPYTSPDPVLNVRRAIEVANDLMDAGFVPYIPHLTMFWHLLSPKDYKEWLEYDKEWVLKCDAVYRMPGGSPGADGEVAFAQLHGIHVYYSLEALLGVRVR